MADLAAPATVDGILPNKETGKGSEMNLGSDVDSLPVFMEDVAEGDRTNLSTIEYEYSSFIKELMVK